MSSDAELHITVVAQSAGRGHNLRDELQLVKAALLYADRVTLASPRAAMYMSAGSYLTASAEERQRTLMEMGGVLPQGVVPVAVWRSLQAKKPRTPTELIALARMKAALRKASDEMDRKIGGILDQVQARELTLAQEAGLLELDSLGMEMGSTLVSSIEMAIAGPSGQFADAGAAIVRLMTTVLSADTTTYPLFSELTGGLARAMVREGHIAGAELAPATHVGVAGQFISAIDAFPDAPMDVVIDARAQLQNPLRRFRSGVTRLSRELAGAGISAIDPRFERASADLYREHVTPALQEIEDLSREIGLRTALLRSSPKSARDTAVAAMALLATTGGGVEELAKLAIPAAADVIGRAAARQRELRQMRDRNEFVFLYEAARRLDP